jgi:hypothetical protein
MSKTKVTNKSHKINCNWKRQRLLPAAPLLGHSFVSLTNLILNCSLSGCWLKVVTRGACAAPIDANSQSIARHAWNPTVSKDFPAQLVWAKPRIGWNGLNNTLYARKTRPKRLRSNPAGREWCGKAAVVLNRPESPTSGDISVKRCCL